MPRTNTQNETSALSGTSRQAESGKAITAGIRRFAEPALGIPRPDSSPWTDRSYGNASEAYPASRR